MKSGNIFPKAKVALSIGFDPRQKHDEKID